MKTIRRRDGGGSGHDDELTDESTETVCSVRPSTCIITCNKLYIRLHSSYFESPPKRALGRLGLPVGSEPLVKMSNKGPCEQGSLWTRKRSNKNN